MVNALLEHAGRHGPGHDVAGRQLVDEALAAGVPEQGAVAPECLRQQGSRHLRVVERCRVELHEFDVGDRNAGAQGHGQPVARGLLGVRRHREQLPGAAAGDEGVSGPYLLAVARRVEGHDAAAAATLDDQVEGEPVLEHGRGREADGVHQRPLDLGAGRGTAGVNHARVRVASFSRQLQGAVRITVEHGAEGDEFVHPSRALVDEHAHGVDVTQADTSLQGVGQVQVGRVRILREHGRHAALCPACG